MVEIDELLWWWHIDHAKIKAAVNNFTAVDMDVGFDIIITEVVDDIFVFSWASDSTSRNEVVLFNVYQRLIVIQEIPDLDILELQRWYLVIHVQINVVELLRNVLLARICEHEAVEIE